MNLEQKAIQIRDIVIHKCSGKEKVFLGGPPYSDHIIPRLNRYDQFLESKMIPERNRASFASVCNDSEGDVIGYQSTTIIRNGKPTEYERKYIGLVEPFTYGILKYIVIDPKYRDGTIARPLLIASLEITNSFGVNSWMADVNSDNRPMIVFLRNHGMIPMFSWITPNYTKMTRMGTDDVSTAILLMKQIAQ